jgi:hypothetical protein
MEVGDFSQFKPLPRKVPGGTEEDMRNLGKVLSLGHHHDIRLIGGLLPVFIFVAFVVI